MNLSEICDLIKIKEYVKQAYEGFNLEKSDYKDFSYILVLLDKKIISSIKSEEFKKFIDFENKEAAMADLLKLKDKFAKK